MSLRSTSKVVSIDLVVGKGPKMTLSPIDLRPKSSYSRILAINGHTLFAATLSFLLGAFSADEVVVAAASLQLHAKSRTTSSSEHSKICTFT